MSDIKEPNFFNVDHIDVNRFSLVEYESLFSLACDELAVGEASPWYLYSEAAVPNILKYNPDSRFIVMVRDPVSMVLSFHNQAVFSGIEPLTDFRDAWRMQERRKRGMNLPRFLEPKHLLYGPICKLGEQVARLHERAGADRVHLVFMDDIRRDPAETYLGVLRFLGVSENYRPDFQAANVAQTRRFPLLRDAVQQLNWLRALLGIRTNWGLLTRLDAWNRKSQRYRVDCAIIDELRTYFRDDIALLESIAARDLSDWKAGLLQRE